ncbi:MAG: hypothetical protein ACRDBP_17225, partial [Luteolibacter sp.]
KNPWMLPVLALTVGAAGGYLSGKNSATGAGTAAAEESTQRTRSSSRSEGIASEPTAKKTRASGTSTDQIARMPGNSTRVQALLDFYAGLTPEQLAEEATKLDGLPMGERMMASFLLFGRWAEVDPTAAMAFSNTMGMAGGFVRPTILQSWASVDPANAAKYYTQNPREFAMMDMMGGGRGPGGGQGGSSIIAAEWARQDPAAALTWANSLSTGKKEAMTAVVGEVAKTDPRKAAEMIASLDPQQRGDAYRSVAEKYGALDFAEAQTWIRTLPADDQARALASAIEGLSSKDPVAAAKQVSAMADGDEKNRLVGDVIRDLARKDTQAAEDFLKEQTNEEAQRGAMRDLMPALNERNPIAALAFVNSYPPGPVRDSAAQAYVWSNNTGEPAELIKVAETITDEGDRNRTVGIAAMRWMREDPVAAKAYVETSPNLSDEAKERIVEGRSMWGDRGRRGPGGN